MYSEKSFKKIIKIYFKFMDKDQDGFITLDEYLSINSDNKFYAEVSFKELDKNNDNKISLKEALNSPKVFLLPNKNLLGLDF
ncbi:MAG: hypothetical protein U0354_17455 [Candidatus Sericytochromatia bacterium]